MNLQRIDTFANRLNKAMNIRGMKQSNLVEQTSISKAKLSQYVNGKYDAKVHMLFTLAQALDVSAEWLFGYDVSMERR